MVPHCLQYCRFTTVILVILVLISCSSEDSVESALRSSAPENPDRLSRANNPDPQTEEKSTQDESPDEMTTETTEQSVQEEQAALLTIEVAGLESCRFGAVRCLINRKYKGALSDSGRLTVELPAGNYEGEIVDSEGQWFFNIRLLPGASATVNLSCSDKVYFGESDLQNDS